MMFPKVQLNFTVSYIWQVDFLWKGSRDHEIYVIKLEAVQSLLGRGTFTGKIGNIHRKWFSSVIVKKTFDVRMN